MRCTPVEKLGELLKSSKPIPVAKRENESGCCRRCCGLCCPSSGREAAHRSSMPPPKPKAVVKAEKSGDDGGGKAPLPLKTPALEKMRNPTARMGKDPAASHRGAPESNRGGKSGQVSHRKSTAATGKAADKNAAATSKKDDSKAASPAKKEDKKSSKAEDKGSASGVIKPNPDLLPKVVSSLDKVGAEKRKFEYLTDELMSRKPLDDKSREALLKKCGAPKQEIKKDRNEGHRPIGRPDELAPSRHERVPPSCIVLMFNAVEASFELAAGDISTLPEADTTDLRSLTSGKVLGRVKITPEKGAHRARAWERRLAPSRLAPLQAVAGLAGSLGSLARWLAGLPGSCAAPLPHPLTRYALLSRARAIFICGRHRLRGPRRV